MEIGATNVKCVYDAAREGYAGKAPCPDQCHLGTAANVMMNADTAITSQFCFLECKPMRPEDGTACIALDMIEAERARTEDGTGEDIHIIPESLQPPTVPPKPALMPMPGDEEPDFKLKDKVVNKKVSPADEVLAEAAAAASSATQSNGALQALGQQVKASADKSEDKALATQKTAKKMPGVAPAAASFLDRAQRGTEY